MSANVSQTTNVNEIVVKTSRSIPFHRFANLLVGCMEGGSNYWIETADAIKPPGKLTFVYNSIHAFYPRYTYPFNKDGGLKIVLYDDKQKSINGGKATNTHILNLDNIVKGTQIFASDPKLAHHWRDFAIENDDAITADVWLQLCLFGEVIYG